MGTNGFRPPGCERGRNESDRSNYEVDRSNSINLQKQIINVLPVKEVFKNHILSNDVNSCESDANSFFVADLGEIYRQHLRWKAHLPRVEPFYAIKCNPDPLVLRLLAALGTGFDCSSKSEIRSALDMGVDPSKIIYANPCKPVSFVRYAAKQNVKMMTFDNVDELHKIKRYFPDAQLVLRILTDDSKSLCRLGLKFGAPLNATEFLLQTAREMDLNVIGVSFHVGSGCYDENAFVDALNNSKIVFDEASKLGFNFCLLDVGGGFTHARNGNGITFERIAAILGPEIDKLFPANIRVIAEPGRYYAAPAFTIATLIIARRIVLHNCDEGQPSDMNVFNDASPNKNDRPTYMYYINDGMYGTFNCILFDHQVVHPKILFKGGIFSYGETTNEPEYDCSIWGPTCDSLDCIAKTSSLPELAPGDWLYFEDMGAYTISAASQFNGFKTSDVVYTTSDPNVFPILYDFR